MNFYNFAGAMEKGEEVEEDVEEAEKERRCCGVVESCTRGRILYTFLEFISEKWN